MKSSERTRFQTRHVLMIVLGVLCGLLLGMIVYMLAKYLLDQMFPFPPGLYMMHGDEKSELMKSVLGQLFLGIPLTWALGTVAGSYCAMRLGRIGPLTGWITGVLLIAYYGLDLQNQPHNIALFVLCPIVVGVAAWAGGWLGQSGLHAMIGTGALDDGRQ